MLCVTTVIEASKRLDGGLCQYQTTFCEFRNWYGWIFLSCQRADNLQCVERYWLAQQAAMQGSFGCEYKSRYIEVKESTKHRGMSKLEDAAVNATDKGHEVKQETITRSEDIDATGNQGEM